MTKVTFETAALADAIKKANVVAPGRGKAFDEAGGIVIDVLPEHNLVVVRATNRDVFYMEWVAVLDIEGDACSWRLPNLIVAPIITSLPIGTGKVISLEEVASGTSSHLAMVSGKTKAKFFLMDMTYYPEWEVFDPDDLTNVSDLGERISMVEWCVGNDVPPLNGVNFNGTEVKSTDRYRVAVVPLPIKNLTEPITIPAGILGQILKQTGDVRVGFTEHQMLLMPNENTQVRTVLYGGDYPTMARLMNRDRPNTVTLQKDALIEVLNRATLASPGDRFLLLHMYVGKESISVRVDGPESNVLDVLDLPGQADHPRVDIRITPKMLVDILNNAPGKGVSISYDVSNPEGHLYISGDKGYEAWMVARRANE